MAPPKEKKDWRARLVCFTCFDMTRDLREIANSVQYLAYGEEICPKTQRKHYQAFAYAKDAQRFSWWQKLLKPMHFEPCQGNLDQNAKYCAKDGVYVEIGVKPMGSGNKRTLLEIKERVDAGESVDTIMTVDAAFDSVLRNERGLRNYEKARRMQRYRAQGYKRKEVIIHLGPTNVGKSRAVYDKHGFPNVYSMPDNRGQWAGSYNGESVVLFDDVSPRDLMPITTFLRWCDGYPIEVPVKGGFTPWAPDYIYFTSNVAFDSWWPEADPEHILAARRRVTEIIQF